MNEMLIIGEKVQAKRVKYIDAVTQELKETYFVVIQINNEDYFLEDVYAKAKLDHNISFLQSDTFYGAIQLGQEELKAFKQKYYQQRFMDLIQPLEKDDTTDYEKKTLFVLEHLLKEFEGDNLEFLERFIKEKVEKYNNYSVNKLDVVFENLLTQFYYKTQL